MKNVFKIALIGIVGIFILTYLTADKPEAIEKNQASKSVLSYDNLPKDFELVGNDKRVLKENLFKKSERSLIIVGNHDSLAVVKELPKYYEIKIPYVMVANISSAPWFVKKMFIPSKLEELNKDTKTPMIYDFEGNMVNSLNITQNAKTKFAVYIVEVDGSIKNIFNGEVKEGALDGSMNEEEKRAALKPIIALIK